MPSKRLYESGPLLHSMERAPSAEPAQLFKVVAPCRAGKLDKPRRERGAPKKRAGKKEDD